MKPEVWPSRVGVRFYRPPRRDRQEGSWNGQSERSGGHINTSQQQSRYNQGANNQASNGGISNKNLPPGHPDRVVQNQQIQRKLLTMRAPICIVSVWTTICVVSVYGQLYVLSNAYIAN